MKRLRGEKVCSFLLGISACAAACSLSACGAAEGNDAESLRVLGQEIVDGTPAQLRTEIGSYNSGCTATMISPGWIITAAHCGSYMDLGPSAGATLHFDTTRDIWREGSDGQRVPVTHQFSLADGNWLNAKDVMIARLGAPVTIPAGIVPATIATAAPTSGPISIWGMGCNVVPAETGAGIMRFFQGTAGTSTHVLCPGDSGGPKFIGTPFERGALFGINSSYGGADGFGDPVAYRSEILAIMATWDANAASDIYATGWCTSANEQLVFIDIEGQNRPSALCHNRVTGTRALARNSYRLLRPSSTFTNAWCNDSAEELLVGDFDGDASTDLLCFNRTTGLKRFDYGSRAGAYWGADWQIASAWCSATNSQLHVGDFNGDARSDLLCQNLVTGLKRVDFADASGHFDGITDWTSTRGWCYHVGARLYTGDANGDGRTDLICHTAPTGAVDVNLSDGGTSPFGDYNDRELRGPLTTPWDPPRLFCDVGKLEIADYNGDGFSDLLCHYGASTWPSLWGMADGGYSWAGPFGWSGNVRVRAIKAASQPWQMR